MTTERYTKFWPATTSAPADFWPAPVVELESDLVDRCHQYATALGAYLMHVGQRKAKGSGTTVGFPDLVLVCGGHVVLIELKRLKVKGEDGGRLTVGQNAVIAKCAGQGVKVHVVDRIEDFVALVNEARRASPRRDRIEGNK